MLSDESFDPDATGVANGNYFGFPFPVSSSALVLISVPWDATVSYRAGSALAPRAIIEASTQVEIYDQAYPSDRWRAGIATLPVDELVEQFGAQSRVKAQKVIEHIENGGSQHDVQLAADLLAVNEASQWLNDTVYDSAIEQLQAGRKVGVVGGDHSVPLGLIRALASINDDFGILHIDAHADLREAYEGFEFSHASIMYNALKLSEVSRLVQVGIRDFSLAEAELALADERVVQFTDRDMMRDEFTGTTWDEQCERILKNLPRKVYVSFDIDGLAREYCPNTGTPVPGGLSWHKAVYLLEKLAHSDHEIIGFDLNEVAPDADDPWDAIVGARMLYKLSLAAIG